MLKRTFPGALAAAVMGVAASGSSLPDFAQDMPARCLPQEGQAGALYDGCGGAVTFGMNGPMVVPGQAPDIEATGSITRTMRDGSTRDSGARPE
jgi:hypothetical protein